MVVCGPYIASSILRSTLTTTVLYNCLLCLLCLSLLPTPTEKKTPEKMKRKQAVIIESPLCSYQACVTSVDNKPPKYQVEFYILFSFILKEEFRFLIQFSSIPASRCLRQYSLYEHPVIRHANASTINNKLLVLA